MRLRHQSPPPRMLLCTRRIQRHAGSVSDRREPCTELLKSRSVSIARKCGRTSDHAHPGSRHPSKSDGRPRQKYPPLTAPDPPTTAPRMICACRSGCSVSVVGYRRTTELAAPIGRRSPSLIWVSTRGSDGPGPASTTVTRQLASAERRSARTDPALPAPTIRTSLCKAPLQVRIWGFSAPACRSRTTPVHRPVP